MLFLMSKTGDKRKKLEEEKGIVIRFVIGHRWDEILFWIIPSVDAFHRTLPSHTSIWQIGTRSPTKDFFIIIFF